MSRLVALGLFVVALLAHLWMLRPIDDGDLFTHIVVGRLPLGSPPLTEMESAIGSSVSWLAYAVFARVESLLGLSGVKALNVGLLAVAFFSLWLWMERVLRRIGGREPSGVALGIGLLSAWLVSATNVSARPQSFAYLAFSLLLLLLEVWSPRGRGWGYRATWLLALLVSWQNLHPSVVMAIPVVGAYVLFQRAPYYLLLLPIIATVCTPEGFSIFTVSARNVELSRALLKVSEWMPPWDPSVRGAMEGFWVVSALLVLGAFSPQGRSACHDPVVGVLTLVFFAMTLSSSRFGAFWGFVSAPLVASLAGVVVSKSSIGARSRSVTSGLWCSLACALLFLLLFNPGETLSSQAPIHLFRELKVQFPRARIFNYREFGGALEYVGYPDWRVFIDGRLYLYDDKTWEVYHRAALGNDLSLVERLVSEHDLFILHSSYHKALIGVLELNPALRLVANREGIVVFAKK